MHRQCSPKTPLQKNKKSNSNL